LYQSFLLSGVHQTHRVITHTQRLANMSWWGGKKKENPVSEKTDAAPGGFEAEKTDFQGGGDSFGSSNFAAGPSAGTSPASRPASGAIAAHQRQQMAQQEMVQQLQQQQIIQEVMNKLTEASFDRCINKPESGLGSSERQCINATVHKWLDTTQFVQGRFQRKAQQMQQQQQLN